MAYVVTESPLGRTGEGDFRAGRKYTRKFDVLGVAGVDAPIGPYVASALVPIRFGDTYTDWLGSEFDLGVVCTNIKMSQGNNSGTHWVATIEYQHEAHVPEAKGFDRTTGGEHSTGVNSGNMPQDPTFRPPVWNFGGRQQTVAVTKDQAGAAYVNSAKDPFFPAVTSEVTIPTIEIQINYLAALFDPTVLPQYDNAINSDVWFGLNIGQVKSLSPTATNMQENKIDFWKVTWRMEVAPSVFPFNGTWTQKILDQGFSYIQGGKKKRALDDYGHPVSNPILLDGSSGKLSSGGTPVYLNFVQYRSISFAGIP